MNMAKLEFESYGFASLPSGTYLFFPVPHPHAPEAPARSSKKYEEEEEHERMVVSTFYGAPSETGFSGVADRSTLFVDLDPDLFDALLSALKRPGRDLRANPIRFTYDLDNEETVVTFEIDGQPVTPGRPKSGIPAPMGRKVS
jgi:hypothetical protein